MAYDYSEFARFVKQYTNLNKEFEEWLIKFIKAEAVKFIFTVKPLTPVDTGDLRDHWRITNVYREGSEICAVIENSMEYASYVEYGHAKPYRSAKFRPKENHPNPSGPDWVAGRFMMTITVDKIEREMPRDFENAFRHFLSQNGF